MSALEFFNPDTLAAPAGAYSQCAWVRAGSDLLYISGQVGLRPDGTLPEGIAEQAEEAYANVARALQAADLTAANLVKLNIFAVQGQPTDVMRAARLKAFGDIRPISTFVFIPQLIEPKYLIEIEAVAAR